jgi:hypothetical protein
MLTDASVCKTHPEGATSHEEIDYFQFRTARIDERTYIKELSATGNALLLLPSRRWKGAMRTRSTARVLTSRTEAICCESHVSGTAT